MLQQPAPVLIHVRDAWVALKTITGEAAWEVLPVVQIFEYGADGFGIVMREGDCAILKRTRQLRSVEGLACGGLWDMKTELWGVFCRAREHTVLVRPAQACSKNGDLVRRS